MPKRSGITLAVLIALAITGPAAFAQQTPREQAAPEPAAGPESEEPATVEKFPVLAVTSVEILRSAHAPVLDIVVVYGVTSAEGWSEGELVPLTRGTPSDGVLELAFVAEAPSESSAPTRFVPIEAILPLAEQHPYKAIRVFSATNGLLLKELPGYAEAKPPSEPCRPCVGKYFAAKGSRPSAGAAERDTVREEDLPPHARIIHPGDGVGDMHPDPNRLTLVLGDDDRIVDAVWE
jgi:hypothetical protein